jgi:drug/metabolite transporter (DMT)-like permease
MPVVDRRAWLLLGAVSAIWGASFLWVALALRDLSPGAVTLARAGLAAAVMLPVALRRGALRGLRERPGALVAVALVQIAGPFLLIGYAQVEVDSGLAGVLVGSTPLWTALLALGLDEEERMRGLQLAGLVIGLAGVALTVGADLHVSSAALLGGVALLLAAVGYAAGGFIVKHRLGGTQPLGVVAAAMLVATVAVAPAAAAAPPTRLPGLLAVAATVLLGAVSGGVGWLLYYTLLDEVGPASASLALYLVPGFAVVYGVVLLGEPLTAGTVGGLTLIAGGSWLAGRSPRSTGSRSRPRDRG